MFRDVSHSLTFYFFLTLPDASDPNERPSATELRKHPYLNRPPGWMFSDFGGGQDSAGDDSDDD
jgi:hypothetical protein